MILPPSIAQWPLEWRDAYQERCSIMADSDVPDAESKAEADIRRVAGGTKQEELFG